MTLPPCGSRFRCEKSDLILIAALAAVRPVGKTKKLIDARCGDGVVPARRACPCCPMDCEPQMPLPARERELSTFVTIPTLHFTVVGTTPRNFRSHPACPDPPVQRRTRR